MTNNKTKLIITEVKCPTNIEGLTYIGEVGKLLMRHEFHQGIYPQTESLIVSIQVVQEGSSYDAIFDFEDGSKITIADPFFIKQAPVKELITMTN